MRAPRSARVCCVADDHQGMLALTADALVAECLVVGRLGDRRELLAEASGVIRMSSCSTSQCSASTAARGRQLQRPQRPARLVFLTVHEDADYARATLDAGGFGYLVKTRLASDLFPAIRAALADHSFVSPAVHLDEARPTFPDLPENPTPTHGKP